MNNSAFDTLQERGFVRQCTDVENLLIKMGDGSIVYYAGFDPTAPSLHVGSLMPIMAMAHLQRAGHIPIAIIGGGTTMIGDPSGKTEARRLMSAEEIEQNGVGILEQLRRYLSLDNQEKGYFINNADWLLPLNLINFLREIGRFFKVNEMIKAESYKQRMDREEGLSFIEFNYQLLQAYDFLVLYDRYKCILQVGGDDQWSNILAGCDLIRRTCVERGETIGPRQSRSFGLTFPLLATALGQKMGKTEKGTIWLDANRTSPYDFYQYWINTHDADVNRFLAFFTFLDMGIIAELTREGGAALREAKKVLAFEVTKLAHGEEEAKKAQATSKAIFDQLGGNFSHLPAIPIGAAKLAAGISIVDLLAATAIVISKGEGRRLVEQKGISVNNVLVELSETVITDADLKDGAIIIRRGKKTYYRIVPT